MSQQGRQGQATTVQYHSSSDAGSVPFMGSGAKVNPDPGPLWGTGGVAAQALPAVEAQTLLRFPARDRSHNRGVGGERESCPQGRALSPGSALMATRSVGCQTQLIQAGRGSVVAVVDRRPPTRVQSDAVASICSSPTSAVHDSSGLDASRGRYQGTPIRYSQMSPVSHQSCFQV